jgi:predicted dehydrogenase
VRVPGHKALVDRALQAGKAVFCEWPLGATLAEAEAMARLASARRLPTAVGLQGRSDPALLYARELVREGYVGEVLSARLASMSQAITERGPGRIWQSERRNGANTLTIQAGHAIDALCFVLGEFDEVSARLATRITAWRNTETGETMAVDSPDWISLSGRLEGGAEVSFLAATVPTSPSGARFEVYGREGTLVVSGGSLSIGPNQLSGARGQEALTPLAPPERFRLVPEGVSEGGPRNVAQAYARLAAALTAGNPYHPDFAHAVTRHTLIEAIERSSADRHTVRVRDVSPSGAQSGG